MSTSNRQLSDESREAAAEWCLRLSDGPLSLEDQQAFEDWIASDADHQALFERTVVAWTAIEHQAAQPEMLRMRGETLDNIHKASSRRWSRPGIMWRQAVAIAACFMIMIAAGTWWRYAPVSYETGTGERRVVALADGSSISLDAATRVDVRFLGDRRELWLRRGRAKFTVAKDALRPFSVEAGSRMVVATGTQFSVERIAREVRVILYEGHVAVMDTSRPKPQVLASRPGSVTAERALAPGHQLIISDEDRALASARPLAKADMPPIPRIVSVDPGRSVAWEGGLLEFVDEPLNTAIERMNRYGTTALSADAGAGRTILISGQFEGGNTDAFVEGVTSLFPVEAVRRPDGTIELRTVRARKVTKIENL